MGVGGTIGIVGGLSLAVMAFIRIFLMRQITDLRDDVNRLERHVEGLEEKYNEERGLKHRARNDLTRAVMALELVRRLAQECKCGVLSPVIEIIDRMYDEIEANPVRRADDLA